MYRFPMILLPMILLVLWSTLLSAATGPPQEPFPGQIVTYEAQKGKMLATAGIDWEKYTRVRLDIATVEFRENWVEDQKRQNNNTVRDDDLLRMKSSMSSLLHKILSRELSDKDGYTLTEESGADVLRFTPRIVNLDVYASGRSKNYIGEVLVDSQGSMVLVMDISDSVSGELLASAVKKEEDPEKGYMEIANSASNRTAFRQMMDRWSGWFFELFEHVRSGNLELTRD